MPIFITAEDMIDKNKFGACYDANELRKLYDRPLTLLEVLTRNDTPEWKEVKLGDRLWVAERKLNGTEALWTPEEKAALIEALKLRLADFKKDYEEKKAKKAFKDRDTSGQNYKDRIANYEECLNEEHISLSYSFLKDRTCQSSKYGYYADRDKYRDLVDTCIAALTPKETVPCPTPSTPNPTVSSPVTETVPCPEPISTETPELDVSQTTPSEKSEKLPSKEKKIAKPRKPAAKKPASGKVSKPASAREKKPS